MVATGIQCIVEWEAKRMVPRIVRLLDNPFELVRFYAAWAIGRLHGLRWVPVLKRHFRRARGQRDAITSAESLYRLTGHRSYLAYLLESLKSRDSEIRASATNSLAGVVTKGNFAVIVCALSKALAAERNEVVRENLCRDLALAVDNGVHALRVSARS